LLCHDAPRCACLYAHHADVVGDYVMELARDPYAFFQDGSAGILLPFPL
jgi:hypothetical protein